MGETRTPFAAYSSEVRSEWLDYNGHMHDASYGVVLSDANEELFAALDLSADYRATTGASLYTVESHVRYLGECSLGQTLRATTMVVAADAKKVRLYTELLREDGRLAATGEFLYLHVDSAVGATTPMPRDRQVRVQEMLSAHADLPRPDHLGPGVVTPYEGNRHVRWDDAAAVDAPLRLHRTAVRAEWVDYNGHMSEWCYLLVFGDNADAFFRFIGIDEAYRAGGYSLYTVETHMHHRREVSQGDPLALTMQLLDHDHKRVHIFHEMTQGETGVLLATAEQMLVHVEIEAGRSAPLPAHLVEHLDAIQDAHAGLPMPDVLGKPMGINRA
jgi:acyl-CoA thioester hydrolase